MYLLVDLQQVANIFNMTVDYKVIELLCIIDEFCKHFDAENAGNLLEDRVKIILYQSNKEVFKVKVLSMFRRRNGTGRKAVSGEVARLALTGDVTRMKTMIIGGAGASP